MVESHRKPFVGVSEAMEDPLLGLVRLGYVYYHPQPPDWLRCFLLAEARKVWGDDNGLTSPFVDHTWWEQQVTQRSSRQFVKKESDQSTAWLKKGSFRGKVVFDMFDAL